MRLAIYKSSLTKERELCYWCKLRHLGVSLLAFNAKSFRWISCVHKF